MTRSAFILLALLGLSIATASAEARKFRVIWNKSPESCATIGWCQVDGDAVGIKYVEIDDKREAVGAIVEHKVDHTTTHHGITSHFARLTGLKSDTLYQFQVIDSINENDALTFRTAPAGPASFSFMAGGDSRNHRDARKRANRAVAILHPLFVCFGGDMINKSTPKEWADWLDDWGHTKTSDGHMTPIIAARGNHEGKKDIHAFFDTPIKDDYYAVPFGGDYLRVYTLNSNITRAGSQGKWLSKDLAEHAATHWKVAHYHHPFRPHQSGKAEQNAQYNAWAQPFYEHGLDLAIECDSHVVKRTWPLRPSNEPGSDMGFIRDDAYGTTFIGEGCWGAPIRANDDDKKWTRASGSFNAVNWICVTPEKITTRTVKGDSVDKVTGTIDPADPFKLPEGLEIWAPESGAVVTLLPRDQRARPELATAAFTRVTISANQPEFSDTTNIFMKYSAADSSIIYQIRYTLDGTDPKGDSHLYTAPFQVDETTTIRAALFTMPILATEPESLTVTKKAE